MKRKPFEPNLNTPADQINEVEQYKLKHGLPGTLHEDFRNDLENDIGKEAEQIAKSHGIYLEFNRAGDTKNKEWMYMVRLANPSGGPVNREQYRVIDELSKKYTVSSVDGNPSIRLTTRQTFQFHWLSKKATLDLVKTMAENGMNSLNGCGDNTRNVMAEPMSRFSNDFNAVELGHKLGDYFQLPVEPFIKVFEIEPDKIRTPGETTGGKTFQYEKKLLNRKFKIAVSGVQRDNNGKLINVNGVEVRTNDLGIVPIIENDQVTKFQIYVGGGQGERNGKPSTAALSLPLCIVTENDLQRVCDAIVHVHADWGDRQNRHWARLKYVIKKMGIAWFREKVEGFLNEKLTLPIENYDPGPRVLNHGWQQQESNGKWAYGMFIENGRITDASPNGKLQSLIRHLMDSFNTEIIVTANQDLIFTNIEENDKAKFDAVLKEYNFGMRNNKEYSNLRKQSGACVGRDTCRLTYTDSEKFEPFLIDELEELGWGDLNESIGITGCERQCFRPSTKTIGLVGTGLDRYQFRFGGSVDTRYQGAPLMDSAGENIYLRMVPRDRIAPTIHELLKYYQSNKEADEDLGSFNRRIGNDALIAFFKENPNTSDLMEKPFNTSCVID